MYVVNIGKMVLLLKIYYKERFKFIIKNIIKIFDVMNLLKLNW